MAGFTLGSRKRVERVAKAIVKVAKPMCKAGMKMVKKLKPR